MVTTTSLKVGESLTIGLYFNNNYQLPTTCNLIVFIGGVRVGNLFTQEPGIEKVGIYYTIRLSSQDTSKMRGYRDLIVVLDDPDGFGNKKFIVGGILFDRMADEFITTSENQGYNMLIGMTVDESIVSGNVELIEAIKGENGNKGEKGDQGIQGIQGEKGDKGDKGDAGTTLHANLTDKNSEAAFQHVDTTVTKETLDEADKVPLYDSVTGEVVLTSKNNFGGSSSPTFTSDFVANPAFGKYTAGSTVPANGKVVNEVLLDAFSNYLSPAFTSFSSALATIVEVGTTLTSPQNFTFGVSNSGNIKPNTLKVTDTTAGADLVTGAAISSPVSVPIGAVVKTANTATNSWRASAQNTQDVWFNSPTFSVTWRLRTFHGAVDAAPANSAEVRALTAAWDTVNSFAITLSKTRYCIALRAGKNLVSVITQNNENLKDNFVKRAEQMLVTLPDGSTTAYDIYDFTSAIVMNVTATVTLS
jgi:hypothetical protein